MRKSRKHFCRSRRKRAQLLRNEIAKLVGVKFIHDFSHRLAFTVFPSVSSETAGAVNIGARWVERKFLQLVIHDTQSTYGTATSWSNMRRRKKLSHCFLEMKKTSAQMLEIRKLSTQSCCFSVTAAWIPGYRETRLKSRSKMTHLISHL